MEPFVVSAVCACYDVHANVVVREETLMTESDLRRPWACLLEGTLLRDVAAVKQLAADLGRLPDAEKAAVQGEMNSLKGVRWDGSQSVGEALDRALQRQYPASFAAVVVSQHVSRIIAAQVAAGGVDTDGTRAAAERYLGYLATAVCEGLRATNAASRQRLTARDSK